MRRWPGYALGGGPLLASSVLASTCLQESGDAGAMAEHLPGIASGQKIATLAVADDSGAWDPAACTGVRARRDGRGYVLTGAKSYVLDAHLADVVLVVGQTEDGPTVFSVSSSAPGLKRARLPLLDQTRRMSRLEFSVVTGRPVGVPGGAGAVVARTLLTADVALAAEQVGGIRRCLDMAVEYARIRVQFSRPIGGFQAAKHMCADMYTLMETARSAVLYAAWCAANDTSDLAAVAHLAKAYCSEAYCKSPPTTSSCTAASASRGSTTAICSSGERPRACSTWDLLSSTASSSPGQSNCEAQSEPRAGGR
ncbi:MAG: acyl-CoA dehydrogenase [Streptosporangiaceae bacterium]